EDLARDRLVAAYVLNGRLLSWLKLVGSRRLEADERGRAVQLGRSRRALRAGQGNPHTESGVSAGSPPRSSHVPDGSDLCSGRHRSEQRTTTANAGAGGATSSEIRCPAFSVRQPALAARMVAAHVGASERGFDPRNPSAA